MAELAYFRYFEYGLFEKQQSAVLINWYKTPEPAIVCSYLPIIGAFMGWVASTYEKSQFSIEKYSMFEWVIRFPNDRKNTNLILFKMRWADSLNQKNSGISS